MFSAVLLTAGCAGLEACQMFHKPLMSDFLLFFGWFSVALKWLTERSGKQWNWHGVCGGPAQTFGNSRLAVSCGIIH